MPTYDYKCSACRHKFSRVQSIKEDAIRTCPKCKKRKAERLIGAGSGIIFKGSGFYTTDYRSSSYKEGAKADKPAPKKTDKKDSKKSSTDKKPSSEKTSSSSRSR